MAHSTTIDVIERLKPFVHAFSAGSMFSLYGLQQWAILYPATMPMTIERLKSYRGQSLHLATGGLILNLGCFMFLEALCKRKRSTNVRDLPAQYSKENKQFLVLMIWALLGCVFIYQRDLGEQRQWKPCLKPIFYCIVVAILVLLLAIGMTITRQAGKITYEGPELPSPGDSEPEMLASK